MDCEVCSSDIEAFYDISAEVARKNTLLIQAAATHHQGNKTLSSGRVVLLYDKVCYSMYPPVKLANLS